MYDVVPKSTKEYHKACKQCMEHVLQLTKLVYLRFNRHLVEMSEF